MVATSRALAALRWLAERWRELLGTVMAGSAATTASGAALPEDKAEAIFHVYDGGGVKATGPALLVRKSLFDRVSVSAQYYVDAVSNASIDVVTTASAYKETRTAYDFGLDTVVRDSTLSLSASRSTEPDYVAEAFGLDVAHEVFGGMSTVSLGFTRARDQVGQKGVAGWIDQASHWQYRAGLTQILTPRWLMSANVEVISDDGFLGSPYRAARVFGAAVPERNPRTRTSRATKFRSISDTHALVARSSVRAEYRYYWDTWGIKAHTFEIGGAKYLGQSFLLDVVGAQLLAGQGDLLQRQRAVRDAVRLAQPPAQHLQEHVAVGQAQLRLGRPAPPVVSSSSPAPTNSSNSASAISATRAPVRRTRTTPTCCSCT